MCSMHNAAPICYGLRLTLKKNKEEILTALPGYLEANLIKDYIFALENEDTDNPHLQGYLRTTLRIQNLRKKLIKAMPFLQGNGSYSFKQFYEGSKTKRVDESYRNYCCKGIGRDNFTMCCSSYTGLQLTKFNNIWWDLHNQIGEVKKNHQKALKKSTTEFYIKVYKKLYSQQTLEGVPLTNDETSTSAYIKTGITQYFVDNQVIFNKTKFVNTYCYILSRVNKYAYQTYIENQIAFI